MSVKREIPLTRKFPPHSRASSARLVGLTLFSGLSLSMCSSNAQEHAPLPSTEQFIGALTACGAGSRINISADLIGSISAVYQGNRTSGTAAMEAVASALTLLPQNSIYDGYRLYISCVVALIGRSARPNLSAVFNGVLLGDSSEFIRAKLGAPRRITRLRDGAEAFVYWDDTVAVSLLFIDGSLAIRTACAKREKQTVLFLTRVLGDFTFADISTATVFGFWNLGYWGGWYIERATYPGVMQGDSFVFWWSYAFAFDNGPKIDDWLSYDREMSKSLSGEFRIGDDPGGAAFGWRNDVKPNCISFRDPQVASIERKIPARAGFPDPFEGNPAYWQPTFYGDLNALGALSE